LMGWNIAWICQKYLGYNLGWIIFNISGISWFGKYLENLT